MQPNVTDEALAGPRALVTKSMGKLNGKTVPWLLS